MAARNIPTDRAIRDVFEAMFPRAVEGGKVDLNQVLRDCQFSARAVLGAVDPDFDNGAGVDQGQAIAVAKSYVEASIQVLSLFEVYGWPHEPKLDPTVDQEAAPRHSPEGSGKTDPFSHRQIEELAGLPHQVQELENS